MRRSRLNLDAKDFATLAAWSDHDNLLSTCLPRSLSAVVYFMMLLPRRRAWIGPVNVDLRCMIMLYIFLGVVPSNFCRTIPGVQREHCLVSLSANPSFLRYSIFLCFLPIDKFPQSVVIWGGRLWKSENIEGPRTDPWGTLWAIMCVSESDWRIVFVL